MKENNDEMDNVEQVEAIGLLDTEDMYVDSDDDIDIFENKESKSKHESSKNKDENEDSDEDDDGYVLNDYGTSEIEESELIIEDMGEFEKDDYWTGSDEGYEGVDIEEL